jgi:hypothetical protein
VIGISGPFPDKEEEIRNYNAVLIESHQVPHKLNGTPIPSSFSNSPPQWKFVRNTNYFRVRANKLSKMFK